jgi:subtilisin family serine protease
MKKIISSLLLVAMLATVGFSIQEPMAAQAEAEYRKGEVVIELKPEASIEALNGRYGTATIQQIYGTNFYRLRVPQEKKEAKWRKRLSKDADVLSASLNPTVTNPSLFARATVSFPDGYAKPGFTLANFQAQRELFDLLKLEDVLQRSRGAGVVVAVIDTGLDPMHPMVAGNLWRDGRASGDGKSDLVDTDGDGLVDDVIGWDFVDNDNDPSEEPGDPQTSVAGHGTFVAGLITTLAPQCRIMPIRAFPPDGISDGFTVAAAVTEQTS